MRWVAALVLLWALFGPAAAWAQAAQSGLVVAEGTEQGRARLVVGGGGPIAVSVDGRPQPITTTPVLSDRLVMALVVDASADGGPGLQPGLGGLVDFALAVPPGARTTVVADTTPPAVVAPLRPGPGGVPAALSGITPRGDRQTAAALDLATAQLPREPDGPRLVVLYTAADATAEPADGLAARLRADGVVLAVVTTADDRYWAAVAAGTGGVAVSARPAGVIDAFDQVENTLRTRSLVTLPAPGRSSTPAVVRVGPLVTDTEIPATAGAGTGPGTGTAVVVLAVVVLAVAVLGLAAAAVVRRPPRVRPVWNVPDPAVPAVDRGALRSAIENALAVGGPVVVRPAEGRAGMGVTTAMLEFAHRYRDAYDVAWWIAAQDPQLIAEQMARLAEALGVAAPTDPADRATAAALAALRQRGRWLLVFDDAGGRRDLARFLPEGAGHVLFGAAGPDWGDQGVAVPPFTRAESVELLRARCDGLSAADADRVAAALADVPLDVDAAGATLAATGLGADAYLDAVAAATTEPDAAADTGTAAKRSAMSAAGPEGDAASATVPDAAADTGTVAKRSAAAWSVAFDRLAADDPPALALLTLVAWLGPEPVPLTLLAGHTDHLPTALVGQDPARLAATLARRGLARVDPESVQQHRVPAAHLVARTADERPDDAAWASWAVRLLRAAVPSDPEDPAGWPPWRRLMPHVLAVTDPGRPLDDVAVDVGWLLHQAAGFLRARGDQESARALLEDAHDLYRRRLGPDHPETRAAARALADNLRALGRQARRLPEDASADGAPPG